MNTGKIIDFLKKWKERGPWVLTSIQTDKKKIMTNSFNPSTIEDLEAWLAYNNGRMNIYFQVNDVITELNKKSVKEDIQSMSWLHVDVDPDKGKPLEAERERILAGFTDKLPVGIPKPTVVTFSGGGYQAFWRLKEPILLEGDIKKAEEAELYNKRLEQIFGGDACHNCDRIMRLPFTENIPDAKKIKAGRKRETAYCLEFNDFSYDLAEFKKAHDVQCDASALSSKDGVKLSGSVERIMDLSELDDYNIPERIKIIIAQGRHPDKPKEGDNSRSAWLFDCVCQLYRNNVPEDMIFALITDPDWGISGSILENKNPEKYAIRQMTRAKETVIDPDLAFMNERHAIIGNLGGKCRVVEEVEDKILGRSKLTVSSFADIQNRYSNKWVMLEGEKKTAVPLGKYWLTHKERRQYDYLRFAPLEDIPNVYNLWRGFSVEPKPTDCSLYLAHLEEVICNGCSKHYEYLISWMARAVQNPASQGEVAVVLRGGKGVGKGVTCKYFGRLFGRHYMQIANSSHLVGQFNSHLRDVVVLFADEAFYAGDKKHESVLKMLITEDTIPIEQKGIDVEISPNYVHLIMASNDPHVIRASGDERRYFLLDVSDKHRQEEQYFKKIIDQMENGGLEGLLYFLQSINLKNFNVRKVPQTQALVEQKELSFTPTEEWWHNKIERGHLLDISLEWEDIVHGTEIYEDYIDYCDKWSIRHRMSQISLGRFLGQVLPGMVRKQVEINNKRIYVIMVPPYEECKSVWEKITGVKIQRPIVSKSESKNLSVF